MNKFILIFLFASVVCGQKAGLRVKYGKVLEEAIDKAVDKDFFFDIPRTVRDAEAKGWQETARPPNPLPHLKMYCPVEREVCALYHPVSKFVAGLQLALPVDGLNTEPKTIEKYFDKWSVPASDGEPAKDYWAITQYFLPKESIDYIPTKENGATLQFNGVWVKGPEGNLMEVSVNENNLSNFTKQSCIPNMGTHYYYQLSRELKCEAIYPWFPLVKEGKLIGLGFMLFGKQSKSCNQYRDWYETTDVPKKNFVGLFQTVLPDAPSCFADLYSMYKYTMLHIYFIDEPWKVTCSPGDSIKPLPEAILKSL